MMRMRSEGVEAGQGVAARPAGDTTDAPLPGKQGRRGKDRRMIQADASEASHGCACVRACVHCCTAALWHIWARTGWLVLE